MHLVESCAEEKKLKDFPENDKTSHDLNYYLQLSAIVVLLYFVVFCFCQ